MQNVSQNRKIAVAAVAIFAVSFSFMMFFLNKGGQPGAGKADILGSHGEEESVEAEVTLVTDQKGLMRYAQESFCAGLELKCADLMGKSLFDYVHPDDTADLVAMHTRILLDKEAVEAEGPFRFKGGATERLVLLSAEPVLEDGKIAEIRFVVKDLTEKVEGLDGGSDEESEAVEGQEKEDSWVDKLYPRIRQLEDGGRLMVDKITYKK